MASTRVGRGQDKRGVQEGITSAFEEVLRRRLDL